RQIFAGVVGLVIGVFCLASYYEHHIVQPLEAKMTTLLDEHDLARMQYGPAGVIYNGSDYTIEVMVQGIPTPSPFLLAPHIGFAPPQKGAAADSERDKIIADAVARGDIMPVLIAAGLTTGETGGFGTSPPEPKPILCHLDEESLGELEDVMAHFA